MIAFNSLLTIIFDTVKGISEQEPFIDTNRKCIPKKLVSAHEFLVPVKPRLQIRMVLMSTPVTV